MREKLQELRMQKEMTQEEVAKHLSISRSNYANIECGNSNPSFNLAMKIKDFFSYQNDDIFLNKNV